LSLPTYDAVAAAAGVRRCRGITVTGHYCERDHRKGEASVGVVHWADRLVYRTGIRRFLLLCAVARSPVLFITPRWVRVWQSNVFAYEVAADLKLQLPRALADTDRAIVRADLAKVEPGTENREEALTWSRR
jgi:hypothetical protein